MRYWLNQGDRDGNRGVQKGGLDYQNRQQFAMNRILQSERLDEKVKYMNLATASFDERVEPNALQIGQERGKSLECDPLILKQKSTYIDSENLNTPDFDLQEQSYPQQDSIEEQKQDMFLLNDQSNDPVLQYEISDDVSEAGEELFSPKTHYLNTDIGSPIIDYFPIDIKALGSSREFPLYIREHLDSPEMESARKSQIRREKVERYLHKKQNRCYSKRIAYHSRKTVAQSRLRVKGRFITKCQAERVLERDLSRLCNKQIKHLLQVHYSMDA